MLVFAAIVPHPLSAIPGIGTEKEKNDISKTISSLDDLRVSLEKIKPDVVVVISPHGKMEDYHFVINSSSILSGDFFQFGLDKKLEFKNDAEIFSKIKYACELVDHFVHLREFSLDYGALVPLDRLLVNLKPHVVHLCFALLSHEKHYEYGQIISNALRKSKKRIAVIASGELSHKTFLESSEEHSSQAKFFDYWTLKYLANNDVKSLIGIEKEVAVEVSECGLRSFLILLGMIYQEKYTFNMLSYENSLGTGYLVARFL